ncbi:MAG: CaiB/BaiF CoA transferase family protein [Candidatus Binatia bacterium]
MTSSSGPLGGVRIIDLSAVISGPLATMVLGDQGADVIKVEPPGVGDVLRMFGAIRGGISSTFVNLNRSKRSVVVDLRKDRGKDLVLKMAGAADVFVQNFRPGVVERMGLGYEKISRLNRDLIYVSISGFGEKGPFAGRKVYDNIVQGLSGFAAVQANPDSGKPELVRNLCLDKATAYTVAQAVTAALLARQRGKGGQLVEIAMLDVALAFLWPDGMMNHTFLGEGVMQVPPLGTIYNVVETADGFMTVAALSDEEWAAACRAMEREDLVADPRFASIFDRLVNMAELRAILGEISPARTTEQWCRRFEDYDVAHAPILAPDEVPDHAQVRASASLVDTEHPVAGPMREPLPAAHFSRTPAKIQRPAPSAGEHTAEVLSEFGLSGAEIEGLRADHVIA